MHCSLFEGIAVHQHLQCSAFHSALGGIGVHCSTLDVACMQLVWRQCSLFESMALHQNVHCADSAMRAWRHLCAFERDDLTWQFPPWSSFVSQFLFETDSMSITITRQNWTCPNWAPERVCVLAAQCTLVLGPTYQLAFTFSIRFNAF